ncbi:MAG: helix-turn-helix domain-containing protein [Candidatus Latescibacteria bacterium]|nr:helix-turn-helix domain-containing protein [Candidatus Latescibacterota bacterium]
MVVLIVGIPGVDAEALPRSNDSLEFVAVDSLADALAFLDGCACDVVMIGPEAADMASEPLAALGARTSAFERVSRGGSASIESRPESGDGPRERGDVVESVFRRGSIRDMERLMILDRLARLNQNRTRSAESLAISVRTLRNKLRDYRQATTLVTADSESS